MIFSDKDFDFWIENRLNVLMVGKHGVGKCLGKDTPILLYDGRVVPVQEIKKGDLLMGPDSKPRKVLNTCTGMDELYEIIPNKGDSYVCNSVHVLTLKMSGKEDIFDIPLNEFLNKSKTFQKRSLHFRVPVKFKNNSKIEQPAYLLGLWLGDGTSRKSQITNTDTEVINYIYDYANKMNMKVLVSNNIEYSFTTGNSKGQKRDGRNKFYSFLKQKDLIQNKHIPHNYLTASRKDRLELLAGIIDSDGSLSNKCFDIIQKSYRLTQDILFLARSLGFAAYASKCKKSYLYKDEVKTGDYYRITISGETNLIPCKISRKLSKKRLQKKNVLKTGFKVKSIGIGEYFGFTLDGDGRFLLGDFTVTHNTAMIKEAFERHNLKWKYFSASTMDPWVDFVGVPKEKTENGVSFLDLVLPKSFANDEVEAIFFDEFNRSPKKVRNAVMELIQFKSINGREFKNLKLIWAAINPPSEEDSYDVEDLDPAQLDRFHIQLEIDYKPSRAYFIKKYGEVGNAAIDWWSSLPKKAKDLVSPRRLDYAVSIYNSNGDLRHVLPKECNIKELTQILKTGPFEEKLSVVIKGKHRKNGEKSVKDFISDKTCEDLIVEGIQKPERFQKVNKKDIVETFLPYLREELVSKLLSDDEDCREFVIKNLHKVKKFQDVVESIMDSKTNKGLCMLLSQKMKRTGIAPKDNVKFDKTPLKWPEQLETLPKSNKLKNDSKKYIEELQTDDYPELGCYSPF